jgi:hypothetical protein
MKITISNKVKLFILLLIGFSFQVYATQSQNNMSTGRIKVEDKASMTKDAMAGLEQHKNANKGMINLATFKPLIMEELYGFLAFEGISREELLTIKKQYEKLQAESNGLTQKQIEGRLINLFENMIVFVNDSTIQCVQPGATCNNWGCCKGLTCAPVPVRARQNMGSCKRFKIQCVQDGDCCSGVCGEGIGGEKVCAVVRRCFRPQRANQSCDKNPTCEVGNCELFNANTTGMGECSANKVKCKSDDQCCSGKCHNKICKPHYTCKNCIEQGKKPRRAEKCCEGLYKAPNGKCIPQLVPFVNKEKQMKKDLSILGIIASFMFGDLAYAQDSSGRDSENSRQETMIKSDQSLVDEEQMKALTGMSKNARENVDIKTLDDFKEHELPSYSTKAGTDFNSCKIDLKADYLINLKLNTSQNMLGVEMAVLAFEHMVLGEGTSDYWSENGEGGASTNIHARAATVAQKHADQRALIFGELDDWQIKMECLCWDTKGYPKLDAATRTKYENQCPTEFAAYTQYRADNSNTTDEDYAGDASGIKGKFLITKWTDLNRQFYTRMYTSNSETFQEIYALSSWLENNDWGENDAKTYEIFNFTTKEWSNGNPNIAAAATMALLAAGVVAISGGFATATMATLWVSFGIIAGAGTLGASGMWLIGAMKGAWESRSPYLKDEHIKDWKCGKKSQCSDFKRAIILPKAKACNKLVSGNGCIKNFLVHNIDGVDRYIVDPWVPVGLEKTDLLKDTVPLANRMNTSALAAIARLKSLKPSTTGSIQSYVWPSPVPGLPGLPVPAGMPVLPGMQAITRNVPKYQPTTYLSRPLLDSVETGYFAPKLKSPYESYYRLSTSMIEKIKDSAKEYAKKEEYLFPNMQADLNKFADYSFDFHFVWPRLSQEGMIAYPMPGMISYFVLMADAMNVKQDENWGNVEGFNDLHAQHLQDLINTINGSDGSNKAEGVLIPGIGNINSELDNLNKDLAATVAFNGLELGAGNGIKSAKSNLSGKNLLGATGSSNLAAAGVDPSSPLGKAALAFGKNRAILDSQKQKLAALTNAVGEKRVKELIAKKDAFRKSFFSPIGSTSGLNLNSLGAAGDGGKNANEKPTIIDPIGNFGSQNNNLLPKYDGGYNSGGFNQNSGASNYSADDKQAQSKIKQAIEYRNQNPADFLKQDGDSLFKIITRSYIRNYDKLLKKRKKRLDDDF